MSWLLLLGCKQLSNFKKFRFQLRNFHVYQKLMPCTADLKFKGDQENTIFSRAYNINALQMWNEIRLVGSDILVTRENHMKERKWEGDGVVSERRILR